MVSKAVCTSAQGAIDYFKNHLNAADYFVTSEKVDRGEFIGKVAERLNLSEKAITREEFVAFVNCDMKALGADSINGPGFRKSSISNSPTVPRKL